jgi:hypothetical protein
MSSPFCQAATFFRNSFDNSSRARAATGFFPFTITRTGASCAEAGVVKSSAGGAAIASSAMTVRRRRPSDDHVLIRWT